MISQRLWPLQLNGNYPKMFRKALRKALQPYVRWVGPYTDIRPYTGPLRKVYVRWAGPYGLT
jgi:hypothetical protein